MFTKISEACVQPALTQFYNQIGEKSALLASPVEWLLALAPAGPELDSAIAECLARHGGTGIVYWEIEGKRLSAAKYIDELGWELAAVRAARRSDYSPLQWVGGCGSRGGPGFRLANGKCAGWR